MLMNLDEAKRRWDIVSRLFTKSENIDAFVEYQAELNELLGIMTKEDYTEFIYGVSDEEFIGSMMGSIANGATIDEYEKVLNGERTVEDLIDEMRSLMGMN